MYCSQSGCGILERGVVGRPFKRLRCDLLRQIGPSAPDDRACYILRQRPLITRLLELRHSGGPRGCVPFPPCTGGLMSSVSAAPAAQTGRPLDRIGVGIDTSRYGHYAAFLRDDLQPACAELSFPESADGYARLQKRLELLAQRHPQAAFVIRLDVAGQYADNLLHFL